MNPGHRNDLKVGVISDTHNFLDPQVMRLFTGVDHILHGGDVGLPKILLELEQIAPVTAVGGNTDDPGFQYSLTETLSLAGRTFLLHHIVNPHSLTESLAVRIRKDRPDVVVFGHSHKPFCERLGTALFFNPGYAGKARFGLTRSVAVLHCSGREIRHEYFQLD